MNRQIGSKPSTLAVASLLSLALAGSGGAPMMANPHHTMQAPSMQAQMANMLVPLRSLSGRFCQVKFLWRGLQVMNLVFDVLHVSGHRVSMGEKMFSGSCQLDAP